MDQKQIINGRQFAWLTAALLTGGSLISVQQALARVGRMDAWFSNALPMLYVAAVGFVFFHLVKRFPGKHLFEITKIVFGPVVGTLVNLLLLFHLWVILVRDLSSFGKFVNITLLRNTPEEIILLVFVLLLMFYGKTSVEVIARVNDLFFPLFVIISLALPLLLANELNGYLLKPLLSGGVRNMLYTNLLSLGWYGDVFVMGAFLHTLWAPKQVRSSIRHGMFVTAFLLTLFLLMELLVLGPDIPGKLMYPYYHLVQQIHVTEFLDRMDLFILSIWFPIMASEVIVIYLAFLIGIASLVKQRDYSAINTPVSLLLLPSTLFAFKSATEVFNFGNYSSPVLLLAYQPLLFLLLWLFARRRPAPDISGLVPGEQQKEAQQNRTIHATRKKAEEDSGGSNPLKPLTGNFGYQAWKWSSNTLLFVSLVSVGVGVWAGKQNTAIGTSCGITYGCCIIILVLTSYMELSTAKRQ